MRLLQVLRVIDSLQLTANHSVATPVDWKHGDKCMVVPSLSDDQANAKFPKVGDTRHMLRLCCGCLSSQHRCDQPSLMQLY